MNKQSDETVLRNGFILINPEMPQVLEHGVTIFNEKIIEVNAENCEGLQSVREIDCSNCLIMPGLINTHVHATMSLLRGIADDQSLATWLNDYIFPAEAKFVNPDFVYLGTSLSAVEALLGGTTTFADAYFFMEQSAQAAIDVGIRSVVAQGILDVQVPDCPQPEQWPNRIQEFLNRVPVHDRITPALFCHSPYLCGPETYLLAHEIAEQNNIRLFSHLAETAWERETIKDKYGSPPIEYLAKLGILDSNFVAVHAVHVLDHEISILSKSRTPVAHCPKSNMKLASGSAPVREYIKNNVIVGVGTDGPASNNCLDMFEEMRTASLLSKLVSNDPQAFSANEVIRAVTIDGARTLGLEQQIGSLEPGKFADIIVIDLNASHLKPIYDIISHLVYAAKSSDVRDVFVNGSHVVKNRHINTINTDELFKEAELISKEISHYLNRKVT